MTKQAKQLRDEFERLYNSPAAYRPGPRQTSSGMHPVELLNRLADYASQYGPTAGDTNILAVELMKATDFHKSYADGFDDVVELFNDGRLKTITGDPMVASVPPQAISFALEQIAVQCRFEAFREYTQSDAAKEGLMAGDLVQEMDDDSTALAGASEEDLKFLARIRDEKPEIWVRLGPIRLLEMKTWMLESFDSNPKLDSFAQSLLRKVEVSDDPEAGQIAQEIWEIGMTVITCFRPDLGDEALRTKGKFGFGEMPTSPVHQQAYVQGLRDAYDEAEFVARQALLDFDHETALAATQRMSEIELQLEELEDAPENSTSVQDEVEEDSNEFDAMPLLEIDRPEEVSHLVDEQITTVDEPARLHSFRWCSVRKASILPGPDGVCPACGTRIGVQ